MLAKNEDALIKSLWGEFSTDEVDKFTDILLYFSKSKTILDARLEWSQLLEYKSLRNRVCICGRGNNNTVYIRNVINDNVLRIGKECVYKFHFDNDKPESVEDGFIPMEDVCIQCKERPVSSGRGSDKFICNECYTKEYIKSVAPFPTSNFLVKIKLDPAEQLKQSLQSKELREQKNVSWVNVACTSQSHSSDKSSDKSSDNQSKNEWKTQKHRRRKVLKRCQECGCPDELMRVRDSLCNRCYRTKRSQEICISCGTQGYLHEGLCVLCMKNKRTTERKRNDMS